MKILILEPEGWPCDLSECPPGNFLYGDMVGFKSEYSNNEGKCDAYCDTGEYFATLGNPKVQPLKYKWVEGE